MAFLADYQGQRMLYKDQYCRILTVEFGKNSVGKVTYGIYARNPKETNEYPHEAIDFQIDTTDFTGDNTFAYAYAKTKENFLITQDNA